MDNAKNRRKRVEMNMTRLHAARMYLKVIEQNTFSQTAQWQYWEEETKRAKRLIIELETRIRIHYAKTVN